MKAKRKRIASFLCFFKPTTKDDVENDASVDGEASPETRRRRRSLGRFISRLSRSKSSIPKSTEGVGKPPKESSRRILSKIVRSISSDSLNFRGGKLPKLPSRSLKKKESGNESFMKSSHDYNTTFSVSSKSSCSSCLSVPSSSALYSPARKRTVLSSSEEWNYGYATGVCFLLLSFCVLVFFGRMCAILWTATWLSFVPRRRKLKVADVSPAAMWRRAEEEKRRVVMEGFLQRNPKFSN